MVDAFAFRSRHQIRCPQQLFLLKFWERHRIDDQPPPVQVLMTEDLRRIADKLMLCEVVREGGELRFLTRLHGAQFKKVHGTSLVGRFVDETVPPAMREDALSRYREVAVTGLPDFVSVSLCQDSGPIVVYERLLLPFGVSGSVVAYICTIVTMITEGNGFNVEIALKGRIHEATKVGESVA